MKAMVARAVPEREADVSFRWIAVHATTKIATTAPALSAALNRRSTEASPVRSCCSIDLDGREFEVVDSVG
jgi:hypothetical protein